MREPFSGMKESRKISWIYSAITIGFVIIAGVVFYFLSSAYIENLYFKYLSEKAHAVATERFEKDELDEIKYRNVVLHRQNSIPTSKELFISMERPQEAAETLLSYLTAAQIEAINAGKEVYFKHGEMVGSAFVYYDNEGTYAVLVLSRNPYGKEISRVVGWTILALVMLSALVLYLISRLYAIKVVDRIDSNYQTEKLFVNNASHEINNPLTAIQGECDIALMRPRTPAEYQGILLKISAETTRIITIMNDLLTFSRTRSERLDAETLDRIEMGAFARQFEAEGVSVSVSAPFCVMAQERLLGIAFRNLVGNAVKYSKGRPIRISVSRGLVAIQDEGIGIPADELPHIFSPFYRARNADSVGGHGIGLALSKAIIEKYGGRIAVSSTLNRGTLFEIHLPPHASGSTTFNA